MWLLEGAPTQSPGPPVQLPPPLSHPRSTLAKGTSPDTEGKGLTLASPGVSSFLRDYYKFSGSCPSPVRLRSQARAWHQLCWVGGGSEATKASPGCPWRGSPHPLAPGKQKVWGPEGLIWPHHHWVGGGGQEGAHLPSTPPALLILRDTFTGGNSQRSEEGNG